MDSPQIVGIGGFPNEVMREYVVGLARGRKVLFVGTASMEDPSFAVSMYESLRPHGEVSFLRFNPWHSLPAHRPLGNSNRARRQMYWELAELRQTMNQVQHLEPTGDETFEA